MNVFILGKILGSLRPLRISEAVGFCIAVLTTWCYGDIIKAEVMAVTKKTRLGLYLEDEITRRRIKVAAAKRNMSTTAYCTQAIKERLVRDGEMVDKGDGDRKVLLARMDRLKQEIGPVSMAAAELIEAGRRI